MSHSARTRAVRQAAWTLSSEDPALNEEMMPNSLASTLLAIRQRRGALFMLDSSRWLIERWNLESDGLQEQSEDTIRLVQRLLKS
jgi:hypothetical protein